MKTMMSFFVFAGLLLSSCGNDNKESKEEYDNTAEESTYMEEAKDCDEFIDQYEKWTNDYIVLLTKYMENPMDESLSSEFMTQGQKASFWMTEWNGKLLHCTSQEKYQKRFEEISAKAEKKMKELGIE
jgi:hypothetical protein